MIANQWSNAIRLGGLRRFAIAISILNILGHTVLGFEQSWAQPLVALTTAYSLELLFEVLNSWSAGRKRPCQVRRSAALSRNSRSSFSANNAS